MKRYLVFTLLLFPFLLNAQSISLDCGKSSSSFIYTDSNGDKLDNLTNKWGDILSVRYAYFLSDKFDVGLGLQKNEYVAQSLDSDNKLDWDVSYFGLELDFGYSFDLINSSSGQFIINGLAFEEKSFNAFSTIFKYSGSTNIAFASPCCKINFIDSGSNLVFIVFKTAPAINTAKWHSIIAGTFGNIADTVSPLDIPVLTKPLAIEEHLSKSCL